MAHGGFVEELSEQELGGARQQLRPRRGDPLQLRYGFSSVTQVLGQVVRRAGSTGRSARGDSVTRSAGSNLRPRVAPLGLQCGGSGEPPLLLSVRRTASDAAALTAQFGNQ